MVILKNLFANMNFSDQNQKRFAFLNGTNGLVFFIALLLMPMAAPAQAQKFNAFVDNNAVQMGQYINLTVKFTGKPPAGNPSFSALNQDFDILSRTNKSSETSIVNGSMSSSTSWTTVITPKKEGASVIPPIKLGQYATKPITIVVAKASLPKSSEAYYETSVSKNSIYVQEQLVLSTKLFVKVLDLSDTTFSELKIENALVLKQGDQRQSQINKGGVRYHLIEQDYVIFPEKSGKLRLPSIVFNATAHERASRFDRYGKRRRISAQSQTLTIDVKPIPAKFPAGASWLPASALIIADQLKPAKDFQQGEPITLTLLTQVTGLSASSLAPLELNSAKGLKIYPDQGKTEDQFDNKNIIGKRIDSFAVLPTQSGVLMLPAISIPWWDVNTDQLKYAKLNSKRLTIKASDDQQASTPPTIPAIGDNTNKIIEPSPSTVSANNDFPLSIITMTVLFIIVWLTTIVGFIFYINKLKKESKGHELVEDHTEHHEGKALANIRSASKNQNASELRLSIMRWAKIRFPEQHMDGLTTLCEQLQNGTLENQLGLLDQLLFSQHDGKRDDEEKDAESVIDFALIYEQIKAESQKKKPGSGNATKNSLQALYSN